MAPLDGRLEIAEERRVVRRDDRVVRFVDELDPNRRVAESASHLGDPGVLGRARQHAAVEPRFGDGRDHVDLRRVADAGPEPREADRRFLYRVGEFVLRERADLCPHDLEDRRFLATLPSSLRRYGGRAAAREQPRERADEPVVRVLIRRLAAVAGDAFRAQLQPDELLLSDGNPVDQRVRREEIAAAEAAFVDHVFRIELGVMVRDHPARAERAAHFLVRLREQDHVARQRHALALQPQERQELRDALSLHVHRAARPQLAAANGRRERIGLPLRAVRGHDVHVMEQDHRLAGGR